MIAVFGSVNLDLVARVERIAGPGETVIGPTYAAYPGGKGANQALAARRAGAEVALAGAVGRDSFAGLALAHLRAAGVDLSAVAEVDAPTGAAFVAVDAAGQNAITVAAGANTLARAAQLASLPLGPGDWLLLQREVPDSEGEAAARHARARGAKVMLNLAPAGGISPAYLALVDILLMNEHEAEFLARSLGVEGGYAAVAGHVALTGGAACIVTLGAMGALAWRDDESFALPAHKVEVVDTTAAGDAFAGALAAALDEGAGFEAALRQGLAAGSLACTMAGAQPSLPHREAILGMLV